MAYLVNYAKAVKHSIQHLPKASATVGAIHLHKPKQHVLEGPLTGRMLLNPVSCNSKVSICITCLPCITCDTDLPSDSGALMYGCRCEEGQYVATSTYI